jgi:TRAP-type uncharacterized transport system substrate-binding protein
MHRRFALTEPPTLWLYIVVAVLCLSAVALTVLWLGPLPPRSVLMSTGAAGSDYDTLARRYQTILRRSGVELRLIASAGGVENLRRLNDPRSGVSVAFAQGGLTDESRSAGLESLGTMFFEPLWIFARLPPGVHLEGLRGKTMSIGAEGSGTRALSQQLLGLNRVSQDFVKLRALAPREAADALLRGQIDAAAMVAAWDTQVVRDLLASPDLELQGFPRADAYTALYPYLFKLRVPAGVGNLATNRPSADVTLLAPKASLIVRDDLHPAIQYLLLEAAAEIHSAPNIFWQSGQFPADERGDVPLSRTARQFYKSGTPFLQRYLPFWLAVLASRLLLLLIPILGIAYPLVKLVPRVYRWSALRRVFRMYWELKVIELELQRAGGAAGEAARGRLLRLEERANRLLVPVRYAPDLYTLRTNIELVRTRLSEPRAGSARR